MFKFLFTLFALAFGTESNLKNDLFHNYYPDVIPSNNLPVDLKLGDCFSFF